MKHAVLVYPHHLFGNHPGLARDRLAVLIEDSLFFGDDRWPAAFHKQKLLLHRASMRAFESELNRRGYTTRYLPYRKGLTTIDNIRALAEDGIQNVTIAEPSDDVLSRRIQRACKSYGITLHIETSPMFMTPPDVRAAYMEERAHPLMADFYRRQRKRTGILMSSQGKPMGGTWSYDTDNRKRWPRDRAFPPVYSPRHGREVDRITNSINDEFPGHPGSTGHFDYPVTHDQARRALDHFLEHRLRDFGAYEDAISATGIHLNHSVLTPALNIGLLTPDQVIQRTLDYATGQDIPINSLEGFVRQVIGWREFMHMVYEHRGVEIRNRNFWNHERAMPRCFYDGTTGLPPVDIVIRRVLDHAYCHHIERLMILGNIMVLCRIHPDDVYRWFMELFIDAYDWVMVPNVYSMSQYADGGLITTKPYISGSNYIRKMSDIAKGEWCDTWDGLFWTFIDDHREFFAGNPRLSVMTMQLQNMDRDRLRRHRRAAETFIARMED